MTLQEHINALNAGIRQLNGPGAVILQMQESLVALVQHMNQNKSEEPNG